MNFHFGEKFSFFSEKMRRKILFLSKFFIHQINETENKFADYVCKL